MSFRIRYALFGAAVLCLSGTAAGQNEPSAAQRLQSQQNAATDRAQLEKRFESVGTLLEKSSGARQVDASGDARAQERRSRAREVYQQAQEAYKGGDFGRASKLLGEASSLMIEAVRMAAPEKVTGEKSKTDFNARMESVKALLAAQKRIASEKSVKDAAQTTHSIEKLMQDAEQLAASGRNEQARATLDRAYLIAKAAIATMRGGDTLVRTLHFASKEEEYRYELDRNDTHQMLIKVLLEEKRGETDRMVQAFLDKARQMRGLAESTAAKGDHVEAIKLLEDSTAELVKAIRSAGIYIPG
ncbi:MAG: hypothetical protein ACM3KD_05805 [Hyphomicrobiaceae bacterium]